MRAGVGERFVVGGPLPIPLYRWGPAWGPWGSHDGHHASAAGVVGRGRSSSFLVSSPLTCPPVYVGAPLNRWLEAVYDFPLVYHRTTSAAAAPGEAMVASASHSWSGGGGGAGVLVRGTPFALHSLPVPSSPAQHRAIRAELSSRLPCPSSVWLGGCPGPRGLALCAKGTVEGTVAGSEWVLKPGTAIPPSTGFVFSLPSGFSPVQEGSAVLSVEQLERLHHSDRPPPDLYAHLVPDGLTSAAEYSEAVDELRSSFRRADTGGARALMLQHDLADSVEAVVRALRATAGVLRSKGAREHAPAESEYGRTQQQQQQQEEEGRRWWEIISGHMEEAHDAILQASLGAHWVQASWSPARRTRNQFLPLGRPSLLALQFTSQLLDQQLGEALDDGDYDLAAVLVREISFLKQSLLHSRAFVGLAAF